MSINYAVCDFLGASFIKRFFSTTLDMCLSFCCFMPIIYFIVLDNHEQGSQDMKTGKIFLSLLVSFVVLMAFFILIPLIFKGYTVFSKVFELRMVALNGGLNAWKLFKANLIILVPTIAMILCSIVIHIISPGNFSFTSTSIDTDKQKIASALTKSIIHAVAIFHLFHTFCVRKPTLNFFNKKSGIFITDMNKVKNYQQQQNTIHVIKKRHLDTPAGRIFYEVR